MKASLFLQVSLGLLLANLGFGGVPAIKLVRATESGDSLLRNGGFEEGLGGKPDSWSAAPRGFAWADHEGRGGSRALRCDNLKADQWTGASQTLVLNRSNVFPLVVRGWSKAQDINGGADSGYSLYVDILYQDGTPLWGQTANFRASTHDWQERQLVILPQKPVKSLTLHCILRGHSGTAWFDDVRLEEIAGSGSTVLFEGMPVQTITGSATPTEKTTSPPLSLKTQDGLELGLVSGRVHSLQLDGKERAADAPSGFLARDVAAGSDFYSFTGLEGSCTDLNLEIQTRCRAQADHISFEGRVKDLRGRDRAITLLFSIPIDASGWSWGDDVRHERRIEGNAEFANLVSIGCGATGTMSLYPMAAIWNRQSGLALALDMAHPAQYRLVYHPGTKQLFLAWDLGLVPETARFPSAADFRFVLFRFDAQWGFRAAFEKFMKIFPDQFRVRSKDQGIWMPFTDISTVQQPEDFGFKYHEGNNNVPWDDAHGVLSFRYTEPMTWWMPMKKEAPRTVPEALRIRDELANNTRESVNRMAQVSKVAAMWDDSGAPALLFRDTPWCNGAVWSLNPNPDLPAGDGAGAEWNGATVYWNPAVRNRLYGPEAKGKQDGEYLDSLEGYVTTDLNFRREHFRYSTVPLTFASDTKQPALYKGLAVFEFTRWLSQDVHALGKLMFANGVPYRFSFLCPCLDVLGTETDWLREGRYSPPSDAQMNFWRTMSGAKPYLLLMNTDYDRFNSELVERYFQRSLFYGMLPSMFSHNAADNPYWQNPKWYNRDRPLFKRYLPIIRRVAEAGWQPVPWASCEDPAVHLERFGSDASGSVFLTLLNDSAKTRSAELKIDLAGLGLKRDAKARNLLAGTVETARQMAPIKLAPQEAIAIELTGE